VNENSWKWKKKNPKEITLIAKGNTQGAKKINKHDLHWKTTNQQQKHPISNQNLCQIGKAPTYA